ncbi:Na+/H+ antiporter [Chitinophaga sp. 30R24]|uniref:Na+/H+ antiporter n=1 Tax=Chitinophaga sp. 30R24 TaxID=3248838 RepID=UPI003B90BD49
MLITVIQYIILIFIILFLVMLAQKLKIAYPIILVLGGLLLSFFKFLPSIRINPELILLIFLPPLLYEAAWYTSWRELWHWRRIISSFAFLIVIVTSFVVAIVSSSIIPGFTLALGFVLGSIVSPPDAVSATSVMQHVKVPKGLAAIIEGESLMNDASSLTVFRFASAAVMTGSFVFKDAAGSFVVIIVMGIVIGILIAMIYYAIHRWLPTNPQMDVVLTLTAPYVMYITAESFHGSGVLAVVSGGLFLSYRRQRIFTYSSRIQGANVWSTLGFMLNGIVFILIGLELPVIIKELGSVSLNEAVKYGLMITGVLMVTRLLCTFGATVFTIFASRYITTAQSNPGWKAPLVFSWAGMRGVVSLAAALSIPVYMNNGQLFPQRNLILFITFTVILLTLVIQGLTLPVVIRWLNMEEQDSHLPLEEQERIIVNTLTEKSIEFLDTYYAEDLRANTALWELREDLEHRKSISVHNRREGIDHEQYRKVYLKMLDNQRKVLRSFAKDPRTQDEIVRKFQELVDIEEEILRMKYEYGVSH